MIRKLMATTAIAAFVATGAFAQTATPPAAPAPAAPMTAPAAPTAVVADGILASDMIGESVYNGTGDTAENIGDVNDMVIGPDGRIASVVVGVGGFLGLGQKNVALDFSGVKWADREGDRWLVVETSKEALEALPEFDATPYEPANVAATDTAPNASSPAPMAQAPATDATPAPMAQAPATPAMPSASGTDSTSTAAIDRSKLKEIPAAEIRSEELVGTTVYGANDANVGEIGDVVLSADGKVDAIIIDVGGFLGIGEKEVAVGMDNLAFMSDASGNRYLYTNFTKDQLETQPAYDEGTYTAQRDQQRLIIAR